MNKLIIILLISCIFILGCIEPSQKSINPYDTFTYNLSVYNSMLDNQNDILVFYTVYGYSYYLENVSTYTFYNFKEEKTYNKYGLLEPDLTIKILAVKNPIKKSWSINIRSNYDYKIISILDVYEKIRSI